MRILLRNNNGGQAGAVVVSRTLEDETIRRLHPDSHMEHTTPVREWSQAEKTGSRGAVSQIQKAEGGDEKATISKFGDSNHPATKLC